MYWLVTIKKYGQLRSCEDRTYHLTQRGIIIALNLKTGQLLWKRKTTPSANGICVSKSGIYTLSAEGVFSKRDPLTGHLQLHLKVDDVSEPLHYSYGNLEMIGTSSGVICLSSGCVFMINGENGELVWKFSEDDTTLVGMSLCMEKSLVTGINKNRGRAILFVVNISTGRLEKSFDLGQAISISPPGILSDIAYFTVFQAGVDNLWIGEFMQLELPEMLLLRRKEILYNTQLEAFPILFAGKICYSSLLEAGKTGAYEKGGYIHCRGIGTPETSDLKFRTIGNPFPLIAGWGEFVVAGCSDGYIYCYDLTAKKEKFQLYVNRRIQTKPTIFDQCVICASDGALFRISLNTGSIIWKFVF